MSKPLKIYLIAGEASGDLLGAHLMRAIKQQSQAQFYGIGGDRMAGEGLASLFPYHELSMMGFLEILPYVFNLMVRMYSTVEDILAKQPDVVVTIDSPGFCFRVVEKLRKEGCKAKFVHYVAPSVWAYKPERAAKCARIFDHLLCLLPFEPAYFEKEGLAATWVGHPVVAETQPGNGAAFREKYQLSADTLLFCLLPGSRKGEIKRHMPIFAKTIAMLATQYSNLAMAVAVPRNVMPQVAPYFQNCPFRAVVTTNEQEKKDAIAASNCAIVKSGTVAVEVAMAGTPMIVAYRVNALSAWWFRRLTLIKYANLINIIQNKEIIPEFLQELCMPLLLASASAQLLLSPNRRQKQQAEMAATLAQLVPSGMKPSERAAQVVLSLTKP